MPTTAAPPSQASTAAASRPSGASTARARRASWSDAPWSWLCSLRIGLVLLAALTVASMVGTAIDPLERAQRLVFYTWWYESLLLALAINMAFSTWRTLEQKVLPSRRLRVQASAAFFRESTPAGAWAWRGGIEPVAAAFRAKGYEVAVAGNAGVARSGWVGLWGAPVSHLGLIAVLLAGFASAWVAKEGVVKIVEGASVDTMQLRDGKGTLVPLGFNIALDDFSTGFFPRTRIPSHFESTVTATGGDGAVLYRGVVEVNNSPMVNGWSLHQTSYEEIPRLSRHQVAVTAPGASEPMMIEMSLGQTLALPRTDGATLTLGEGTGWTIRQAGATVASGSLGSAHHGSVLALRAERFEPDFVLGENRQITSRSSEPNNPALQVTLLSDGAPAMKQWLFGRADMKQFAHAGNEHFKLDLVTTNFVGDKPTFAVDVSDGHSGLLLGRVELALGEEKPVGEPAPVEAAAAATNNPGWQVSVGPRVDGYATVLSLSRNPAIPVIYVACGVMMIGLLLGFFVPRREVFFLADGGELRVVARYRHPAKELDTATRSILDKLTAAPAANS